MFGKLIREKNGIEIIALKSENRLRNYPFHRSNIAFSNHGITCRMPYAECYCELSSILLPVLSSLHVNFLRFSQSLVLQWFLLNTLVAMSHALHRFQFAFHSPFERLSFPLRDQFVNFIYRLHSGSVYSNSLYGSGNALPCSLFVQRNKQLATSSVEEQVYRLHRFFLFKLRIVITRS